MGATVLTEGTAVEAGLDPARLDRIRERAAAWVAEGLTPSLVMVAARHGIVALHEAYGRLTPEPDSPALSIDSVFPVSSLCKPMTASALLMLVEEGLVGLNLPVVRYIPELAGTDAENILVHHLLTHTSGYTDADVFAYQRERLKERIDLPPLPDTQHKTIHLLLNARYGCAPTRPPRETMTYCNHGFELVAEIIRRTSGQSFSDFMRERIFEPLAMTDSSYRLEDRFRGRMVKRLPFTNPFAADLNDEHYVDTPYGGGGLNATALDVARFAQAFLNGGAAGEHRLLSQVAVREMTRNQIPDGVPEEGILGNAPQGSYGYGWFVLGKDRWPMNGALLPTGTYAHGGMGGAVFWVDPLNDIVGAFFSVWTWDEGVEPAPGNPVKLNASMFEDMVTTAVID